MKYEFEMQYKIASDIREILNKIKEAHTKSKLDPNILARASIHPNTGTIYQKGKSGPHPLNFGIRINKDYIFSPCLNWVLPDDQKGLSLSASWSHLNKSRRMIERFNEENMPNNVWWITKSADLPKDMKFIQDREKKDHYFLTVTDKMTAKQLHDNLVWISDRMTVITDISR